MASPGHGLVPSLPTNSAPIKYWHPLLHMVRAHTLAQSEQTHTLLGIYIHTVRTHTVTHCQRYTYTGHTHTHGQGTHTDMWSWHTHRVRDTHTWLGHTHSHTKSGHTHMVSRYTCTWSGPHALSHMHTGRITCTLGCADGRAHRKPPGACPG